VANSNLPIQAAREQQALRQEVRVPETPDFLKTICIRFPYCPHADDHISSGRLKKSKRTSTLLNVGMSTSNSGMPTSNSRMPASNSRFVSMVWCVAGMRPRRVRRGNDNGLRAQIASTKILMTTRASGSELARMVFRANKFGLCWEGLIEGGVQCSMFSFPLTRTSQFY